MENFISMVDRQFQTKVQSVRSDNGTEFTSMKRYFQRQGILHETSCVGTPQQNGRAERKHRHILNVARALHFQSNLPMEFWGECILTAGYLINRTPSSVLNGLTPFEVLHGKAPDYTHLRVFGSLCFAHNQSHKGDKFATHSRKSVFVGYPYGKKGWRLYDLERQEFFISRDVVFFEHQFPFHDSQTVSEVRDNDNGTLWAPTDQDEDIRPIQSTIINSGPIQSPKLMPPQPEPDVSSSSSISASSVPAADSFDSSPTSLSSLAQSPATTTETSEPPELLGRGQRKRTALVTLHNYVMNTAQSKLLSKAEVTSTYPISNYVDCQIMLIVVFSRLHIGRFRLQSLLMLSLNLLILPSKLKNGEKQ